MHMDNQRRRVTPAMAPCSPLAVCSASHIRTSTHYMVAEIHFQCVCGGRGGGRDPVGATSSGRVCPLVLGSWGPEAALQPTPVSVFDLEDGGVMVQDGEDDLVHVLPQPEVDLLLFLEGFHELMVMGEAVRGWPGQSQVPGSQ